MQVPLISVHTSKQIYIDWPVLIEDQNIYSVGVGVSGVVRISDCKGKHRKDMGGSDRQFWYWTQN
jgi:hypothetical protein